MRRTVASRRAGSSGTPIIGNCSRDASARSWPKACTSAGGFPNVLMLALAGLVAATALLVYLVAHQGSILSVPRLLLAGVAMSAMMGAFSSARSSRLCPGERGMPAVTITTSEPATSL